MEQRQVEGIDAYNFPADMVGHPLLTWMGNDYVRFVAVELRGGSGNRTPAPRCLPSSARPGPGF